MVWYTDFKRFSDVPNHAAVLHFPEMTMFLGFFFIYHFGFYYFFLMANCKHTVNLSHIKQTHTTTLMPDLKCAIVSWEC